MMAVGSLECSSPSACPSSCTATRNRSFPVRGERVAAVTVCRKTTRGREASHAEPCPGGRRTASHDRRCDVTSAHTSHLRRAL